MNFLKNVFNLEWASSSKRYQYEIFLFLFGYRFSRLLVLRWGSTLSVKSWRTRSTSRSVGGGVSSGVSAPDGSRYQLICPYIVASLFAISRHNPTNTGNGTLATPTNLSLISNSLLSFFIKLHFKFIRFFLYIKFNKIS